MRGEAVTFSISFTLLLRGPLPNRPPHIEIRFTGPCRNWLIRRHKEPTLPLTMLNLPLRAGQQQSMRRLPRHPGRT